MKLNSLLITSSATIVLAALLMGGTSEQNGGQSFQVNLTLAQEVTQFDEGLDVRDAQGRPISAPAAKRQLRQLFVGSLFALLMRPELPVMAETLALLRKTWNLASGVLGRSLIRLWSFCLDLWLPANKRWKAVPALMLLALVAALTVQGVFVSRFVPRTESHLKQLSTTLIRC